MNEKFEPAQVLEQAQRNEITGYHVYKALARTCKNDNNRKVLQEIANNELAHYDFLKNLCKKDSYPSKYDVIKYRLLSRLFGLTFTLKLMEKDERRAGDMYKELANLSPEVANIIEDEDRHESLLITLIDEDRLKYTGSIVLGLNDALVELTGTLAGFTLAFERTDIIAMAGLIAGIAASFSMGISEYLSTKADSNGKNPVKASGYTTIAYILTVFFLIIPFLFLSNSLIALSITILNAIFVVFVFTYYISIAKDLSFEKRFAEMTGLSLGIAALTFVIGYVVRIVFDINL
ncbi:MAG: VIT1/CCC1 transporter family protein [Methanomassiliicoccales archaeon]|jgi:VIT1/CCC1 family predicted Fe2+/Mn2+ transporter|nr:VIT1/CCC1 transporter family protein [Methanomassiliicoccales archaeon]